MTNGRTWESSALFCLSRIRNINTKALDVTERERPDRLLKHLKQIQLLYHLTKTQIQKYKLLLDIRKEETDKLAQITPTHETSFHIYM